MARIRRPSSAERDLIAQWPWYAEHTDLEIADRFPAAMDSTAAMLATQPESGGRIRIRTQKYPGLRHFRVADGFEKFLILYYPLEDGIELIRVLHGSRDLRGILSE